MAGLDRGQTFIDHEATNIDCTKAKYLIALSDADDPDDRVPCFVMNTERHMHKYHFGCNKEKYRCIVKEKTFTFINNPTSIMLKVEWYYTFEELCGRSIELLDIADDLLCRQIKNCIDWNQMLLETREIINKCF